MPPSPIGFMVRRGIPLFSWANDWMRVQRRILGCGPLYVGAPGYHTREWCLNSYHTSPARQGLVLSSENNSASDGTVKWGQTRKIFDFVSILYVKFDVCRISHDFWELATWINATPTPRAKFGQPWSDQTALVQRQATVLRIVHIRGYYYAH